jgi:hypothetical protein
MLLVASVWRLCDALSIRGWWLLGYMFPKRWLLEPPRPVLSWGPQHFWQLINTFWSTQTAWKHITSLGVIWSAADTAVKKLWSTDFGNSYQNFGLAMLQPQSRPSSPLLANIPWTCIQSIWSIWKSVDYCKA